MAGIKWRVYERKVGKEKQEGEIEREAILSINCLDTGS